MKPIPFLGLCVLCACQQQALYDHYPFTCVQVQHRWERVSPPRGMRMVLFSHQSLPGSIMQNIHPLMDSLLLIPGTYRILSYSNDSEFLRVRNESSWENAQVYIPTSTRILCDWMCDEPFLPYCFYWYATDRMDIENHRSILQIQAMNMVQTVCIKARVEGISEISVCKAYLGGMIGARYLHNGLPAGVSGTQQFTFELHPDGIEVHLPTLGAFPQETHPLILDFIFTNGAVKRFHFELNLPEPIRDTILLPDIQLPTQTIGGGSSDGFQGFIDDWGWTTVPIDFD